MATGHPGSTHPTAAGHAERDRLDNNATRVQETPHPQHDTEATIFTAAPGGHAPPPADTAQRTAEVQQARTRVEEAHRPANPDTPQRLPRPAPWEQARPAWSTAPALEAARLPPSILDSPRRCVRPGHEATGNADPASTHEHWHGASHGSTAQPPRELAHCADELQSRSRPSLAYHSPGHHRFLVITPA